MTWMIHQKPLGESLQIMSSNKDIQKKIPTGPATGDTALYAVSLILFMVCGILLPHRNFHLLTTRLGAEGELPRSSQNAYELTQILYSWQGLLIVLFIVLTGYFWWTSTWKQSMSKKSVRFLLWCIPGGLYIIMLWILFWLMFPLRILTDSTM